MDKSIVLRMRFADFQRMRNYFKPLRGETIVDYFRRLGSHLESMKGGN